MVKQIVIGHLYPEQMNVYGDMGNVITLRYRLQARGYRVKYLPINSLADLLKTDVDILVGGGGQDSNQGLVQRDIVKHANALRALCNDGLVALMICGMYQLFGHRFVLPDKSEITGAGVLDLETHAGASRLIGNITTESPFGPLVGFENHSGKTYLGGGIEPLGAVTKGAGNNGEDQTEGALYKNVFATYMHGPVLAKNPQLADEMIRRALERRNISEDLTTIDDAFERQAAQIAATRPR